ncbi:(deoxy)nucleoside triphosphate pyrophosphohydrolase [Paramicrobacterium chengjingii]|uniref:(deoxy)nucleoside triphosphate pyrophosphohydrolase n=1 Tax=Paramicrobacterium chengjingii TaxID=2769067 RepID=UPI0014209854|nr:(deoxy)nucleoside triphosphate pyrophosphohydrolase [Microbacterium chengjingii]
MASIRVVGAVIVRDGSVLAAKRGKQKAQAGLWEFPGGKIEAGESPDAALRREITEELGCTVIVGERVETTTHVYGTVAIELTTFLCSLVEGEPVASEHAELRWVAASGLHDLEWAPADIPAVKKIAADTH